MFWRITDFSRKCSLIAFSFILLSGVSGCSDTLTAETPIKSESEITNFQENTEEEAEKVIACCFDLYGRATKEDKMTDLEMVRSIVKRLGENGYSAVDSKNQIDMTEAQQVVRFCEKVDSKEKAELSIIEVTYMDGFVKYDLETKDGIVDVVRSYFRYENGNMKREVTGSYQAEYWNYTKEGYLMFSGACVLENMYILTSCVAEEHTAFRVQPLDNIYRELNRKYLLPIGYERNNMFLVNWSEDDFGELNFYDIYDVFYPQMKGQLVPYVADDNLSVGAIYQIPKDEFESVIMTYFNIDSKILQSKTTYNSDDLTYEYKPRGFYEVEQEEYPYSEVVGFTENSNGTITLMVNVVFPYADDSKVYAHEVVIRPLDNGSVQYVANRIISSEDNHMVTWHTPRLTKEEWDEVYKGK